MRAGKPNLHFIIFEMLNHFLAFFIRLDIEAFGMYMYGELAAIVYCVVLSALGCIALHDLYSIK